MQPLNIVLSLDGNDIVVRLVNDGPECTVHVEWGIIVLAGGYPSKAHRLRSDAAALCRSNAGKHRLLTLTRHPP